MHRSGPGLGWAGWYRTGSEQVQNKDGQPDEHAKIRSLPVSADLGRLLGSQITPSCSGNLILQAPLQVPRPRLGKQTCFPLSQPAPPAQPALPFPSTDSIRTILAQGWGAQCRWATILQPGIRQSWGELLGGLLGRRSAAHHSPLLPGAAELRCRCGKESHVGHVANRQIQIQIRLGELRANMQ